jgi:uncharacterized protein YjbJ (UPF0337 family)
MDPNRPAGAVRNGMGKIEKGVGDLTGDAKLQAEGMADSIAGKAQNLYGQTMDAASDAAEAIADRAVTLESLVRDYVRERPYVAVGAAFAIGMLLSKRWRSR